MYNFIINSQLTAGEETSSNNTDLKRYVKEYDFRPPIFGSFAYDPVRQEFDLLKTASNNEKESVIVSTLLSSDGTTPPAAAAEQKGRTRKRANDLEASASFTTIRANYTSRKTPRMRAHHNSKRGNHHNSNTETSSKEQALIKTDLHIADALKKYSSRNYSNYMKQSFQTPETNKKNFTKARRRSENTNVNTQFKKEAVNKNKMLKNANSTNNVRLGPKLSADASRNALISSREANQSSRLIQQQY